MPDDDIIDWENAGLAIFASPAPDLRPLVGLLRSGRPIPQGQRDMLADLLDPNGEGYLYLKLELKNTETKRNNFSGDHLKMQVATEYKKLLAQGKKSEVAVEELARKFSIGERTVFNYIREANGLINWLKTGK